MNVLYNFVEVSGLNLLIVLRLEVSVYSVYITNQFQTSFVPVSNQFQTCFARGGRGNLQ